MQAPCHLITAACCGKMDTYVCIHVYVYIYILRNIQAIAGPSGRWQDNGSSFVATHCNTLQRNATCCNTFCNILQHTHSHDMTCHLWSHTATHCNAMQHAATHSATHCNTLQHTHSHDVTHHIQAMAGPEMMGHVMTIYMCVLQCVAECVAVWCIALQCVAVCGQR